MIRNFGSVAIAVVSCGKTCHFLIPVCLCVCNFGRISRLVAVKIFFESCHTLLGIGNHLYTVKLACVECAGIDRYNLSVGIKPL